MQEDNSLNDRYRNPEGSTLHNFNGQAKLCWIALLLVLIVTLMVGLLPRGSFKENWLRWDELSSRTEFGAYGLVHGEFPDLSESLNQNQQLIFDFVIVPRSFTSGEFRILVQVESLDGLEPFVIGQWENYLIIMQSYDFSNAGRLPTLTIDIGEYIGKELAVMVKLNQNQNELFLNGQLVRSHNPSTYDLRKKDARITIGNSPDGKHGWFGGIAKFDVKLLDLRNKQSVLLRSYDFNSQFDGEIIDLSDNAMSLQIPKPGDFPDKHVLQIASVKNLISYNKVDLIVNFIGFWPLGFLVTIVLRQNVPTSRHYLLPVCGAVLVGGLVSLGIELTQPFIPGRSSHFHDLVLNVLGAATGGLWFVLFTYILSGPRRALLE